MNSCTISLCQEVYSFHFALFYFHQTLLTSLVIGPLYWLFYCLKQLLSTNWGIYKKNWCLEPTILRFIQQYPIFLHMLIVCFQMVLVETVFTSFLLFSDGSGGDGCYFFRGCFWTCEKIRQNYPSCCHYYLFFHPGTSIHL